MKMETVIRSPQKGVIAKLVHRDGVSYQLVSLDVYTNQSRGHLQSRNCPRIV